MSTLKLFFRKPGDPLGADLIEIDVNPDELVEFVRKRVARKGNCECAKLIFHGKTCSDEKPLRSYNIEEGETIIIQTEGYSAYPTRGSAKRQLVEEKAQAPAEAEAIAQIPKKARSAIIEEEVSAVSAGQAAGLKVSAVVYGDKGVRRRMEDDHIICSSIAAASNQMMPIADAALFSVLDGHGGVDVVEFVKSQMPIEIGNALSEQNDGDRGVKDAINKACLRIDQRIAQEIPTAQDGCCAVFAILQGDVMYVCNLGDCTGYLCRKEDDVMHHIALTNDHKCWNLKEKERILQAGGRVENGRVDGILEVSRAFGDLRYKKYGVLCTPSFKKFTVDTTKDKFVVLGCDGFWDSWTAEEALKTTEEWLEKNDPKTTCRLLVRHVVDELKSQDNVTVMIITF